MTSLGRFMREYRFYRRYAKLGRIKALRNAFAVFSLALVLTSCSPAQQQTAASPQWQLALACDVYSAELQRLAAMRDQLPIGEDARVQVIRMRSGPVCEEQDASRFFVVQQDASTLAGIAR